MSGESRTMGAEEDPYLIIERSDMFQDLRHRYRRFIFPMGAAFLIWYFLLIIAAGWAPRVDGGTGLGLDQQGD